MGSAGANTAAVIRGEADAYVHVGGQYEWDSAAPATVASAVGMHVSRLNGDPLQYNRSDPALPDLIVCWKGFVSQLLATVSSIAGSGCVK